MSDQKPHILATGQFLNLAKRGNWEYATRDNSTGVVAVVPITDDGHILLVEQFRPPVGANVIELPAGLVGDHAGAADEPHENAARRELLEETGHEAESWALLAKGPTSPGICDEVMSLYLATRLRRIGPPLGDGHENITLHEVPLANFHEWLERAHASGKHVDLKVYSGLYLAAQHRPEMLALLQSSR